MLANKQLFQNAATSAAPRSRDSARSRSAILDAAEKLFAEHAQLVRDAAAMVGVLGGSDETDPTQLLLSVMGLVWFPLAHPPLLEDLGLEPGSQTFRDELKRHVTALLVRVLGP